MRRGMCCVIRVMDDMSAADIYIIARIRDNFKIEILAGVRTGLSNIVYARPNLAGGGYREDLIIRNYSR